MRHPVALTLLCGSIAAGCSSTVATPAGRASAGNAGVVPSAIPSGSATPSAKATILGRKTNSLLIIADDFGIDLSPCYQVGARKPKMPNLERMCDEGVVFDNVWVSPMCTPTRATLLTGRYGFRTDVREVGDVLADTESIQDVITRADPSESNALIGKWHVSGDDDPDPDAPATFGVQHYAGFLSGFIDDYFSWDYVEDGKPAHTTTYSATWMTDKAIEWIGSQADHPWFQWLAHNEPHFPIHLPPAELQTSGLPGGQDDIDAHQLDYAMAMSEALDTEIGRLLASMTPEVRDDTTVLFMGDNGTDAPVVQAPFSEAHSKSSLYEGGIRVPLIAWGAGVTRHGQREDALVNGVDIPATIAALAGAGHSFHDGVSFQAALSNPAFTGRDHVYMDSVRAGRFADRSGWAVRDARYKLIVYDDGSDELYDISNDLAEHTNLIAKGVPSDLAAVVDDLRTWGERLRASPD